MCGQSNGIDNSTWSEILIDDAKLISIEWSGFQKWTKRISWEHERDGKTVIDLQIETNIPIRYQSPPSNSNHSISSYQMLIKIVWLPALFCGMMNED